VLAAAAPGIDLDNDLRKAWAWIIANPAKRKTAAGMMDFLRRWVTKTQNAVGFGMNGVGGRAQAESEDDIRARLRAARQKAGAA
jgi:hypothetical protein